MKNIPCPKILDRWSAGIDHEPGSIGLVELIASMDFHHFNDYFCWKTGGDGDNGETLAYIIDALIENGLVKIQLI